MGGKNSYESIKRYEDKAYDKILLRIPKGQKEILRAHAEEQGRSINGYINHLINEALAGDENKD